MTAREWKPGDVAMLKCNDGQERLAILTDRGGLSPLWIASGPQWGRLGEIAVRPVVVIDPEQIPHLSDFDEDAARALSRIADDVAEIADGGLDTTEEIIRWLADQMPKPPKPEEPQGLGAVVESASGVRWIRVGSHALPRPWAAEHNVGGNMAGWTTYDEFDAVRILSGGVA